VARRDPAALTRTELMVSPLTKAERIAPPGDAFLSETPVARRELLAPEGEVIVLDAQIRGVCDSDAGYPHPRSANAPRGCHVEVVSADRVIHVNKSDAPVRSSPQRNPTEEIHRDYERLLRSHFEWAKRG